jgi:hypothetical protein
MANSYVRGIEPTDCATKDLSMHKVRGIQSKTTPNNR